MGAEIASAIILALGTVLGSTITAVTALYLNDKRNNKTFGLFNLKATNARMHNLSTEYTNISKKALSVIMRKYVQQNIKHISINNNKCVDSVKTVKDLLGIAKRQSVLLIGKAGSGKSTALRWIYLNICNHATYIRMSNLSSKSAESIFEFFNEKLNDNQMVFLDGIDELDLCVADNKFVTSLTEYLVSRNIQFIISARVDHFDGFESLMNRYFSKKAITHRDGILVYEILGFTSKQFVEAAMIVKLLHKADSSHFGNKFPNDESRKKYRKRLKLAYTNNSISQVPLHVY